MGVHDLPEPQTRSTAKRWSPLQLEMLEAGSENAFKKSWVDLVEDFRRTGKVPPADFAATVLTVGAPAVLKREGQTFNTR